MKRIIYQFIIFSAIALAFLVQAAGAHGYVVRAIPDDRAVLERAPTRLQYWFSEALEPDFSTIHVRDRNGNIIASGGVSPDNSTLLQVQLPPNLPDGAYIVELRPAFASDGHVVAESRVFFVGEAVGGVEGQAASDEAIPLEVVWRVLVIGSTVLLFGTFALYSLILVPAWGNHKYRAGQLPPRVMGRLNVIVGIGLAMAFGGNILALLQQSMAFFAADIGQVISGNLWQVVRIGSTFGDIWNARMVFLGLVALFFIATLYYRKRQPEAVHPFWVASAWLMALIVGSLSVVSHAPGALLWPWLALGFDWLHAMAVAFWAGGLVALVLVLPVALRPYDAQQRQAALQVVMRRFSRYATAAVVVVVASGIFSALLWLYTPQDMVTTTWGRALSLKLLLVGLLLYIAYLHHRALHPKMSIARKLPAPIGRLIARHSQTAANFGATLRLEAMLAIAVLVSVGLLSATPIPQPEFINNQAEAPHAEQTVAGLTITQTITPGGPGVNTFDIVLLQDETPQQVEAVWMQIVHPARDLHSEWLAAEPVDEGLYVAASDFIDSADNWLTVIDAVRANGEKIRAAFSWEIDEGASVLASRAATLWHYGGLLLVLGAIGFALYPAARKLYDKLDLSPLNLVWAFGVIIATAIFMIAGLLVLDEQNRRYAETLHPPPTIINPVLPDAASLQRGEALFATYCNLWTAENRDYEAFINGIRYRRDDELYTILLKDGWRSLPPCTEALSVEKRWDVVNYLRSVAPYTD